jgi:para-aminobenzoate synthetase component 1
MKPLIHEIPTEHSPESLAGQLRGETGVAVLRSLPGQCVAEAGGLFDSPQARYSFLTARPFLTFRSFGSRCEVTHHAPRATQTQFGNPWHLLDSLMSRYEMLDEMDLPFPLGGCFGYWGYDLKNFVEPKLPRRAVNDLELPDCHVSFHDSLVVFDHHLGKTWIVSTGLAANGSRSETQARERLEFWQAKLASQSETRGAGCGMQRTGSPIPHPASRITCNLSRSEFLSRVEHAQRYIRAGDIYQVNLSQRLTVDLSRWGEAPGEPISNPMAASRPAREDARPTDTAWGWDLFERLSTVSPAPFSAYLDCGDFQIASSSPELFLRLSGAHVQTRPIKGTRRRSTDPTRDAQLAYELQTSAKENAELVMITDLLRNDLGKVCEFGSVQVPDLARLERFAQVQHLVSTVEGRLRRDVTHFAAFASCFPGGSITGAPKFRAMEIIDELEPMSRGPYTGALGYLGFNRESQLSIIIRAAVCKDGQAHFNVGAGIVADSDPAAEYEETLAKAQGFLNALNQPGMTFLAPRSR